MWDKLWPLTKQDIDGCYTGDKSNFGQPACQKVCMKLMTNVFRNDDIGHPLQPISTDYMTQQLMALGGHKLKDFLDILNYDFLHARDHIEDEKKPAPAPSL